MLFRSDSEVALIRGDDVLRDGADQGDLGIEAPADHFIDLPQVLRNGCSDGFEADWGERVTIGQVFDLMGNFAYYSEFALPSMGTERAIFTNQWSPQCTRS